MRKLTLFACLFSLSSMIQANDALYTARYALCMDHAGGVTVQMTDCIATELNTQDARLNGAYQKLRSYLSAERKKALQTAQRLWVKYRDTNCDFYNDPQGGTLHRMLASECVLRETAERAQELENLAEVYSD